MKLIFLFCFFLITSTSQAQENKIPEKNVVNNKTPNSNSIFDNVEVIETEINNIINETIKNDYITVTTYNHLINLNLQQNKLVNEYVQRLKGLDLISLELQKQIEEEQKNTNKQIEDLKNCISTDNK